MNFIEISLDTTAEGLELVSGMLYQNGLTGLMIEDETDFREFLENPNREWDYIDEKLVKEKNTTGFRITFFVSDNASGMEQLAGIKNNLAVMKEKEKEFHLGTLELHMRNIKEEDWANNWKKYFKPFAIGEKLVIKPSWEEWDNPEQKTVLEIDPGHIFGTGTHETTQLCIEAIETYLKKGDKVLDIGCGSGILSLASLLLGAETADAVDIDPNAVEIAYENASMNHIEKERFQVQAGNILEDEKLHQQYQNQNYDIVEANIVADIIIALSSMVPQYLKKNGIFIASGIITERLADVYAGLKENGFEILETKKKKDWAAVVSCYKEG